MAASHSGSTGLSTPLLNKFSPKSTDKRTTLPTGACNYTNLSVGGNAPRCGCRRFWDKTLGHEGPSAGRRGWCMCEHHACFHDHGKPDLRESVDFGDMLAGLEQDRQASPLLDQPVPDNGVGPAQKAVPDTIQWSRFVHSGSDLGGLPSIPSQCLLPSENTSVASTDQGRYLRPFAGAGLGTLSHIPKPQLATADRKPATEQDRTTHMYEDALGIRHVQSLTDVGTPMRRPSLGLDGETAVEADTTHIESKGANASLALKKSIEGHEFEKTEDMINVMTTTKDSPFLPRLRNLVMDYPITKQNHDRRLDLLENASYTHAGFEELEENHENLDTRVGELEERVLDIEKANAADQLSISSRPNESFASNSSSAIERLDIVSRLHALESQVSSIQAVIPSFANPWEVEVVLLPFGSSLTGIWSSTLPTPQRQRMSSTVTEELNPTQALLVAQDHAPAWQDAVSDAHDDEIQWLFPRACGPRSRVHERLRSRGLVKTIVVYGPGYRDVQAAMIAAFGDMSSLLQLSGHDESSPSIPPELRPYHGLSNHWVPLRKLHKDSCLRFLDPTEMLTPTLWNVSFLYTSVAMRTKRTRRLYFTQPDSYLQGVDDIADWTWHKLRQLPRFYPEANSSFGHTPEADAQESYWEYDAQLDAPPSVQSSFSSQHSLSIRIPPDEAGSSEQLSGTSPRNSPTPTSLTRRRFSPLQTRTPFRPLHTRTTSMPMLHPLNSPTLTSVSKRRITSFDHSPTRSVSISAAALKRRRISRSPAANSVRMSHTPRNTPTWYAPLSPYATGDDGPAVNVGMEREREAGRERKRGMTPTAYATPFSNAPYVPGEDGDGGSGTDEIFGDDEAQIDDEDGEGREEGMEYEDQSQFDQEYDEAAYDNQFDTEEGENEGDEEWEGVQDGQDPSHPAPLDTTNQPNIGIYEDSANEQEQDQDLFQDPTDNNNDRGMNIYEDPPSSLSSLPEHEHEEGAVDAQARQDEEANSEASSTPSEYPSTQPQPLREKKMPVAFAKGGRGFWIHVDEEGGVL